MFRANVIKKPWFLLLADKKNAISVLEIQAESAAAAKAAFESRGNGGLKVLSVAESPCKLFAND